MNLKEAYRPKRTAQTTAETANVSLPPIADIRSPAQSCPMSEETPERSEPKGWAVNGCLFTLLTWLFAGLVMLGRFAGDCAEELGHRCPSDHERFIGLVWVCLGALVINALGLFLLAWLNARRNSRH